MRISLNLATRPFADLGPATKRSRIAMGVLAVVSILLGIGLHLVHTKAEQARARDHSLDGQLARITRERQGYTDMMKQPPNAALLTQVTSLNLLFDEKAFSWTLAMEDLETVLPGGVQVSSIEPVLKDGNITIHLRVIGPRDREVALVQNLEHSKRFLTPRIVMENAESGEGQSQRELLPVAASNPFNFDLLAEYNPAGPSELAAAKKSSHAKEATAEHAHAPARPASGRAPGRGPLQPGAPRTPPHAGAGKPAAARPMPRRNPAPAPQLIPNQGGPQ